MFSPFGASYSARRLLIEAQGGPSQGGCGPWRRGTAAEFPIDGAALLRQSSRLSLDRMWQVESRSNSDLSSSRFAGLLCEAERATSKSSAFLNHPQGEFVGMNWHVWIRNTYCGTVTGATHQEAVRAAEKKRGAASICIYRALNMRADSSDASPERRSSSRRGTKDR
jgi:hypothetical protein